MTEADLLADIIAAPEDDAVRLVYADWLIDRGDRRGELVTLQCAIERLSEDDSGRPELETRARLLLERHGAEWAKPLRDLLGAENPRWRRGMIEHLEVKAAQLLDRGEELFQLAPALRSLRVREVEGGLARILAAAWIGRLRALDFSYEDLEDADARSLASSELSRLESLELGSNEITDAGVAALAGSPHLARLVYLGLETNRVMDDGAVALAESETLASLRELDLTEVSLGKMWEDNEIGPRGGVALAGRPLAGLLLSGNAVGDSTLEALADAQLPVQLVALGLADVGAGSRGIVALARSPRASSLRSLCLSANQITDDTARELMRSPHLRGDLKLSLRTRKHERLSGSVVRALRERFSEIEV